MSVLSLTAANPFMLALCVFLVGSSVAIGPALHTRLMDVAADAQTLAAALNHSPFNIANALGAWLGGVAIIAGYGFSSTGWVSAVLAVVGLGVFGLSLTSDRRGRKAASAILGQRIVRTRTATERSGVIRLVRTSEKANPDFR